MRAIGYLRVSTADQTDSGLGLEAQRHKIEIGAELREWDLIEVLSDNGISGTVAPEQRPAMAEALRMLREGEADALIAAKLDRTSRSAGDFARLTATARREGWDLVLLDVQVDTTTPGGKFVAQVLAAAAELERDLIAERTRDALAALRAKGQRLGRAVELDNDTRRRIYGWRHKDRWTLQQICDRLNADGVPTAQGGRQWWPSTISKVLKSIELDRQTAEILHGDLTMDELWEIAQEVAA